jgi:predicted O-methyltransferase YrrM
MNPNSVYLDSKPPVAVSVGYGALGTGGNLGYEGRRVSVQRRRYAHALSTHPPATLRFQLGRQFASFTCQVALNDDVPAGVSHADFVVLADGREVAVEPYVLAGEPPRPLVADIAGSNELELVVKTSRWEYAHAVWLDPQISDAPAPMSRLSDCLGRSEMAVPRGLPRAKRCIATAVSPKFEILLDDMLGSLLANGNCSDAMLLVFVLEGNEACEAVAAKYGATVVRCELRARLNPMSKALLYSVARVVDAQQFVCLDADMLVLGDLRPVFSALEALPPGKILSCREGNSHLSNHLGSALRGMYGGTNADGRQLQITAEEEAYPLVVNDGIFAGDRTALLALDGAVRGMPHAAAWADGNPKVSWRNQFIFNLALARLNCGVELDSTYNVQLHTQDVQFSEDGARIRGQWRGRHARILHFSGGAKKKYPQWQGFYARVPDPMCASGTTDAYAEFLESLRAWVGKHGVKGLAWSIYGLSNAEGARVRDASMLPLLGALHYLIRSNGCVRVLETGTAWGVSAACLASAVAHRDGGRVVSLDPYTHPGRNELWATLPPSFKACIEARQSDALDGMRVALEAGERYEAILLDSIHTQEHVWAEFELARHLVCHRGLILIHDAIYTGGTVERALRQIETAGYNVVRLWAAEGGIAEDDGLGLAVIENHPHAE